MADLDPKLEQIITEYIENEEYFTINRARQYGKTTMLELLYQRLKTKYIVIDISFEGKEDYFKTLGTLAEGMCFEFQKALKRASYPTLAQIFEKPVNGNLPIQDLGERITYMNIRRDIHFWLAVCANIWTKFRCRGQKTGFAPR